MVLVSASFLRYVWVSLSTLKLESRVWSPRVWVLRMFAIWIAFFLSYH